MSPIEGPEGPWPQATPAFRPYGWALVNSNGSIQASNGKFSVVTGSAGIYNMVPVDKLVENQVLYSAISRGGPAPFLVGSQWNGGLGAVELEFYNAAAAGIPVNTAFLFMAWVAT